MLASLLLLLCGLQSASDTEASRWWPVQRAPGGVVRIVLSLADANPPSVIILAPPLIVKKEEIDIFLEMANRIFERKKG